MAHRRTSTARRARQHGAGSGLPEEARRLPLRKAQLTAAAAKVVEPEAIVATHWFDSGEGGEPYTATIHLTGRRVGAGSDPGRQDRFAQDEVIAGIVPGTGPVSVTSWVYGLRPGEWSVDAEMVAASSTEGRAPPRSRISGAHPVRRATWSWRHWAVSTADDRPIKTRWALLAPLARQPAVLPGLYTALASVGSAVGLATFAAILAEQGLEWGPSLSVALLASLAGLVAAKVWYVILHPNEPLFPGGWAVDGILVVTPLVGVLELLALHLPIGREFDAAAPGLFLALAIARVGCFFTGCCAGRTTASRWGIWSSDRRVGARRIPAQLIESGASLLIGAGALVLVRAGASPIPGALFIVAFATYTLVRQVVLRLRAERRRSPRTIPLTAAAGGLVLSAILLASRIQGV